MSFSTWKAIRWCPGGLEYLFGVCTRTDELDAFEFKDWWAHDRDEEKLAFEGFVDWVFKRWKGNPGMHIYHYAAYEVSAVRRLSTRHDTRQDEVDELLRNEVFVDLYQIVRHGLRIGEDSYSIKTSSASIGRSAPRRSPRPLIPSSNTPAGSKASSQRDWKTSPILKGIRDYNEDDCKSTAELLQWLRKVAVNTRSRSSARFPSQHRRTPAVLPPEVVARLALREKLRQDERRGFDCPGRLDRLSPPGRKTHVVADV